MVRPRNSISHIPRGARESEIEHAILARHSARDAAYDAYAERLAAYLPDDADDHLDDPAWWWLLATGCSLAAMWLSVLGIYF
jgi:hypothetical protein